MQNESITGGIYENRYLRVGVSAACVSRLRGGTDDSDNDDNHAGSDDHGSSPRGSGD